MARVCDYLEISLRPFVLNDQAIIPDQLTCCAEVPTFRHLPTQCVEAQRYAIAAISTGTIDKSF
jgi:hypothetical protein